MSMTMIIAGVVVLMLVILIPVFLKSREVNLTEPTEDVPEWMRNTPPEETIAATKADGEGVTVYDYDHGERLAAPFAEQIEDILRAKLEGDPELKSFTVDFGTAPDGTLEIWVNAEKYTSVDKLPSEKLKKLFRESVKQWDRK